MNLKQILAMGALALTTACSTMPKLVDKDKIIHPFVQTTIASDYVTGAGARVKGPRRQDLLSLNLNNKVAAYVWQDYSFKEKDFDERDFGATFTQPLSKSLSTTIEGAYWGYPSQTLGNFDAGAKLYLNYSGPVDANVTYTHLFWDSATRDADGVSAKLSKTFSAETKDGWKFCATPAIESMYVRDWYDVDGFGQVTPSLNAGASKGKISVNGTVGHQISLNSNYENYNWWKASVSFSF